LGKYVRASVHSGHQGLIMNHQKQWHMSIRSSDICQSTNHDDSSPL